MAVAVAEPYSTATQVPSRDASEGAVVLDRDDQVAPWFLVKQKGRSWDEWKGGGWG